MAEFRFQDGQTSTDYEYKTDVVRVSRRIVRGELSHYADRSRELHYDDIVIQVRIQGVWQDTNSHSQSANDLWQLALDRANNENSLTFYPDLSDTSVNFSVLPVPGEGPNFFDTEKGDDRIDRSVGFESASTFDSTASIWDDLKTLDVVL